MTENRIFYIYKWKNVYLDTFLNLKIDNLKYYFNVKCLVPLKELKQYWKKSHLILIRDVYSALF